MSSTMAGCPRGNKACGFLRGAGCSFEAVCCELDAINRKLDALQVSPDSQPTHTDHDDGNPTSTVGPENVTPGSDT